MTESKELSVMDLLLKTNQKKPKPEDVTALRKALLANPGAWRRAGDLVEQNIERLLDIKVGTPAIRESILAGMEESRQALGYYQSPMIERLLIDQVLLTKLHLDVVTNTYTMRIYGEGDLTIAQAQHLERRLTTAQMRHLRAVESLARIRKMALPVMQVNIANEGSQQLNVAGDLVRAQPGRLPKEVNNE